MNDIVQLITNTSVTIVVIAFFMYRDLRFNKSLESTLTCLVDTVNTLKETVERLNGGGHE